MNEKIHDLTILYLQKQELSTLTPQQLMDKYNAVYEELKEHSKSNKPDSMHILK